MGLKHRIDTTFRDIVERRLGRLLGLSQFTKTGTECLKGEVMFSYECLRVNA